MVAYIKLSTKKYPYYEGDIRLEHPEILESQTYPNFPCPDDFAPVEPTEVPKVDPAYEYIAADEPEFKDGKWYQKWKVEKIPRHILEPKFREERNLRLIRSDWTQLPDAPISGEEKSLWTEYRQQLRDLPAQEGFPWYIHWPVAPK